MSCEIASSHTAFIARISRSSSNCKIAKLAVHVVALAVLGCAACSSSGGAGPGSVSPPGISDSGAPSSVSTTPDPYAEYDKQVNSLLHADATWSTPRDSVVDVAERIGLSFGSIAALKPQIDNLIPNAVRQESGTHDVGPTMSVELSADASDADIAAPTILDRSTGSSVHYLFTWQVKPLHPSSGMLFTANVTIPLSNGHSDSYAIPLSLAVHRTLSYTAHQIFTAWPTWVSIISVLAGATAWLWRRRVKRKGRAAGGNFVIQGSRRPKMRGTRR
jgi:hypothetical protein